MSLCGPVAWRFPRCANLVGFAVGLIMLWGSSPTLLAGVIIPQAEPAIAVESVSLSALPEIQPGAGGFDDRRENPEQRRESDPCRLIRAFIAADIADGASSPESGGGGSTSSTPSATHSPHSITQPPTMLFAHWREVSPRLPRPPSEELLDPPRDPALSGRL
jgi:hypothetical protein